MFHTLWRAYVAFAFTCMSVSHMLLRFFLPQKKSSISIIARERYKTFPGPFPKHLVPDRQTGGSGWLGSCGTDWRVPGRKRLERSKISV